MRYTYDADVDILVVELRPRESIAQTVEVDEDRHVDVTSTGEVVQIEFLNASAGFAVDDLIDRFQLWDFKPFLQAVTSLQTHLRPVSVP
jgi:uncharacterized protein YuzE